MADEGEHTDWLTVRLDYPNGGAEGTKVSPATGKKIRALMLGLPEDLAEGVRAAPPSAPSGTDTGIAGELDGLVKWLKDRLGDRELALVVDGDSPFDVAGVYRKLLTETLERASAMRRLVAAPPAAVAPAERESAPDADVAAWEKAVAEFTAEKVKSNLWAWTFVAMGDQLANRLRAVPARASDPSTEALATNPGRTLHLARRPTRQTPMADARKEHEIAGRCKHDRPTGAPCPECAEDDNLRRLSDMAHRMPRPLVLADAFHAWYTGEEGDRLPLGDCQAIERILRDWRCPQRPVTVTVPADLSHTGAAHEKTVDVDACVAPIVAALHAAGIETRGSCCGHGRRPGSILLANGWRLELRRERSLWRWLREWWVTANETNYPLRLRIGDNDRPHGGEP